MENVVDSRSINTQLPERLPQIDFLKAMAIVSVIILHTFPLTMLLVLGSPYYLWQAVPLFILIAGYTGAYGYKKRNVISLKECYNPKLLFRRYSRLLTPFIIYWILELILLVYLIQVPYEATSLIINFVSGGIGWGSYFIPVILQSVLVVPFLYFIALRNSDFMVGIALCLNIIFEVFVVITGSSSVSSFIYLRYLFAGALGVWLVTSTKRRLTVIVISGIVSFIFITLASYTALFPSTSIFYQYEGILQFPSFVWTLILAMIGLKYLPNSVKSRFYQAFAEIGKASWHIFLVQMLYFLLPAAYVYLFLNNVMPGLYLGFLLPLFSGFAPIPILILEMVKPIINIIICVLFGYAWYSLGKVFRDRIKRIHSK